MFVTHFAPIYFPILQHVLLVLGAMGAHLHHIVLVELVYLLQFGEGCRILVCRPLGIHPLVLPARDLLIALGPGHLVQVHPVVHHPVRLHCLLLLLEGMQEELQSMLRQHLIVQPGPGPDVELSPCRQDTEPSADLPHRPSLHVEVVYLIHDLGGEDGELEGVHGVDIE